MLLKGYKYPLISSFCFFLLISAYYILKPIRNSLILKFKVTTLPYIGIAVVFVVFIATYSYSILVNKFQRKKFLFLTFYFFIVSLLLFYFWITFFSISKTLIVIFYLWVNLFSVFLVSVFWSFNNDIYTTEEAKKFYSWIGLGGLLGSIFGSSLTFWLARKISLANLLLVSVVLLVLTHFLLNFLEKNKKPEKDLTTLSAVLSTPSSSLKSGIGLIFSSPYLFFLAMYVFLFTSSGMFASFAQSAILKAAYSSYQERIVYFAKVFNYLSIFSLFLQLTLTPIILRINFKIGVLLVSIFQCLFSLLLLYYKSVFWAALYQIVVLGASYSLGKASGEMFYLPLDYYQKYKAKNAIDTLFFRLGSAVSSLLVIILSLSSVLEFSSFALLFSLLQFVVLYYLFHYHKKISSVSKSAT